MIGDMHLQRLGIIMIVILAGLAVFLQTNIGKQWIQRVGSDMPEISTTIIPEKPKPVRMIFVGDIMMNRGVESSVAKNHAGDYMKLFEKVSWFRDADIVFGNLEGPVSDVGNNVGSKYSFRMDPGILPILKSVGFTVVSFSNNHVGDWNVAAFNDTLKRLSDIGIAQTGAGTNHTEASTVRIIEKHGKKIGFLGFSDVGPQWMQAKETTPGILLASDPNRIQMIQNAKQSVDFLIVSYHWGDEYKPFTARQKSLAESSIDAGADLIIGHHPHVIQDYAQYKGKLIFYSLGNFMFDQSFSAETMRGLIVDLTINPDGTYERVDVQVSEQDKTHKIIEVRPFERENDAVLKIAEKPITCPKPTDQNQPDKKLFPVSHDVGLGNYVPSNLTPIPKTIPVRGASLHCLTQETITQLEKMISESKKLGLALVISSAYRSSTLQETLFNNEQIAKPDQLFPSVAKPEHSEHQLGTAIDVRSTSDVTFTLEGFGLSPEYAWMHDRAHEYGFVQSYPKGSEKITGYTAEPWHWRYVGIDIATEIKEEGITLYEYLKDL